MDPQRYKRIQDTRYKMTRMTRYDSKLVTLTQLYDDKAGKEDANVG